MRCARGPRSARRRGGATRGAPSSEGPQAERGSRGGEGAAHREAYVRAKLRALPPVLPIDRGVREEALVALGRVCRRERREDAAEGGDARGDPKGNSGARRFTRRCGIVGRWEGRERRG